MLMPLEQHIRERFFSTGHGSVPRTAGDVPVPRVHLVGASGAGMTALSELLLDYGWNLTGSDLQLTNAAIDSAGFVPGPRQIVRFHHGHDAANVPASADLVVFSPAIGEENPERSAAARMGIPQLSYVEFLGELLRDEVSVCIAGTHGKTTTSAMTASILRESGVSSSAVVGGEVIQYGRSGWGCGDRSSGRQSVFVIEACEYRRHFLQFRPRIATILNVEADHFDCFRTIDESMEAFVAFAEQIEPGGTLLVRSDCPLLNAQGAEIPARVETFAPVDRSVRIDRDGSCAADWAVSSLQEGADRTVFDIIRRGRTFGTVELAVPGRHNVENALAAIAVAYMAGVSAETACEAISRFRGVRRRFEEIGTWNGVTLVDDYAHHPTAVRATLAAARKRFPHRRLVVAFQPHQISRTLNLIDDFAVAFGDADRVLLAPVFAAREDASTAEAVQRQLADRIKSAGCSVEVVASLDQLLATLEDSAEPGDVWLTLGAGNINRIPHEFARTVQRNITG